MKNIKYFRKVWGNTKPHKLKLKKRPPLDTRDGKLKSKEERFENVKTRLSHLAEVLEILHKIYRKNKELYGDKFLEFVGYYVIRTWPWKDFPFISTQANRILKKSGLKDDIIGLQKFELRNKKVHDKLKELRYEHWTPLSFFRDIFDQEPELTKNDFYNILIIYYRVVWITKKEDAVLEGKKYKSNRILTAYDDSNIEIFDLESWDKFYQPQ